MLDRIKVLNEQTTYGAIMIRIAMNAHKFIVAYPHLLNDCKDLYQTGGVTRLNQKTTYKNRGIWEIQNRNATEYWQTLTEEQKEELISLYIISYNK